jgi:D-xylose 1-dehydrogenase (NADP+, D-xylono-1,5-lactone-forming)
MLRWGILGTASIARTVVPAIAGSASSEVHAVASRDLERARSFASEMGIPEAFGSYEEMLDRADIDIVYNPLPNSFHAPWTIRALEAGYPVLCEKPFALNGSEAKEVLEVSQRTGLPVAEAFMYRFHPLYEKVLELLDDGAIGSLVSVSCCFSFFEDDRSGIVASAELGGGALMDVGCYCVNFSRLVARAEPIRVSAMQVGEEVDDTLMGQMEFPGGILAKFETSIASTERHGAQICGTEGVIALANPWIPGVGETKILVRRWGEVDQIIPVAGADTYRLEVEDFARAVSTGTDPRWAAEDAVQNMAVIEALFESAHNGKHISLG